MAEVDIEAVNKQRVALGLQPIPVPQTSDSLAFKDSAKDNQSDEEPASTLETREAAAHDNWQKLQAERDAKAERTKRKEAAKKAREKAQRQQVLKGATLADDDEEELDTKQWLEQQRKRQKKIAKAEAAKNAEEDAIAKKTNYTSSDLKGLKVSHQLNEFDLDTEQILTLKDRKIGEESDDDELENTELVTKEKLKEKLELKKRKPVYNPNDDDGTGEKKMLAQYDDVIDGKKRHHFTLDGKGSTVERSAPSTEESSVPTNRLLIGLEDLFKEKDSASDYKKASDIKIKKRTKNPNTVFRKKTFDDDSLRSPEPTASHENGTDSMQADPTASNGNIVTSRKRTFDDMNFDDDDLQLRLARQRAANSKKNKQSRAEFKRRLLQRVAEEKATADTSRVSDDDSTYLDWTELPEWLPDDETYTDTGKQYLNNDHKRWLDTLQPEKWHEEQREITIKKLAEEAALNRAMNGDPEYYDAPMEDSHASEEPDEDEPKDESIALTEDKDISKGLGSTLKLLRERDLLDKNAPTSDVGLFKAQQQFLAEKREREKLALKQAREERERTRQSDGYYKMSNREREEYQRNENLRREEQEASRMADFYERNYKPEVNLKYIDEFHREMTAKEAFKHLSHQFHGKGSGAGKQEKKLKKIEEEKKAMAKSTLDTSNYANSGRPDGDHQGAGIRMG